MKKIILLILLTACNYIAVHAQTNEIQEVEIQTEAVKKSKSLDPLTVVCMDNNPIDVKIEKIKSFIVEEGSRHGMTIINTDRSVKGMVRLVIKNDIKLTGETFAPFGKVINIDYYDAHATMNVDLKADRYRISFSEAVINHKVTFPDNPEDNLSSSFNIYTYLNSYDIKDSERAKTAMLKLILNKFLIQHTLKHTIDSDF